MTAPQFTGRSRKRKTSRAVRIGDRVANFCITFGGIGTVIAVLGVFVFLLSVVLPLVKDADIEEKSTTKSAPPKGTLVAFGIDETRAALWQLDDAGNVRLIEAATGKVVDERAIVAGGVPSAVSINRATESAAYAGADGTIAFGKIGFAADFVPRASLPEDVAKLPERGIAVVGKNLIERLPENQWKSIGIAAEFGAPQKIANARITSIDHVDRSDGHAVVALTETGVVVIASTEEKKNLLTKKVTTTVTKGEVTLPARSGEAPFRVMLGGRGDAAYVLWRDGHLVRIDARDLDKTEIVEELDVCRAAGARITAVEWLNGRQTLVVGDSSGRLSGWFTTKPATAKTADGIVFVCAHTLIESGSAPTALSASTRSRLLFAGFADGAIKVYQVTSADLIGETSAQKKRIDAVAVAPKDDGIIALSAGETISWDFAPMHPEATIHSLFQKVWYEGAPEPAHVWQSSSGTDDTEPKFGLMPLIFGTFKATLYSLLFGVPIALLAAVFTSEFLHPKLRAKVKPTIELMASLPSVVLGFMAGLIIAPWIESRIASVLAGIIGMPLVFLGGAYLWQLLPGRIIRRLDSWRLIFLLPLVLLGIAFSHAVGPLFEKLLFAGDVKSWLQGRVGAATGGWFVLLLPFCATAAVFLGSRFFYPVYRAKTAGWTRGRYSTAELLIFAVGTVAILLLTYAVAAMVSALGFDPRGEVFDTYDSRNALVVGLVMGFAIIPIIYTIAEDALSSVPEHLRAASLGAGATRWQTAVRIVIPTAMSGIFSAIMVGLGRAVGETMIVLMAAGNTPVMSWNVFNGFRTLSANIATELPEAVRNSTHYRTLFLAALVLLFLTFILNTAAELVRRRFRKRAMQL